MKNNIYLLFLFFLILTSCKKQLENSVKTTLYTEDSIYKITFFKPVELDTSYNWYSAGDNPGNDLDMYRYSKRNFPVSKEGGFFNRFNPDSVYRLTISHIFKFKCKTDRISENPSEYLIAKSEVAKSDGVPIDTLLAKRTRINGNVYNIAAYKGEIYRNGYLTHHIRAATVIDGNEIDFNAECTLFK